MLAQRRDLLLAKASRLVAALRETSVVFAAVIAVYFLKEPMTRLRVASIVTVCAGAVAVKM